MSQILKDLSAGPVPPTVATSYVTDDGTAVPAANVLNVLARDTDEYNENGIQTVADPNLSNNLYVEITNRLQGDGSTVDASTDDIITLALGATPAVYNIFINGVGFNSSTPAGLGFSVTGIFRTTGAAGVEINVDNTNVNKEAALAAADVGLSVSGNNVVLTVTGVAGLNITWAASGYYVKNL
jgi:hypothetical protein